MYFSFIRPVTNPDQKYVSKKSSADPLRLICVATRSACMHRLDYE